MNTARKAEEYVYNYFKKKGITLLKANRAEKGFDFRTKDGKLFIEVKGSTAKKLSDVYFRYLTNGEYEKIKECLKNKKRYELHLVIGIDSDTIFHYIVPGEFIIEKAKPEVSWALPVRKKEFQEFMVGNI